MRIKNLVMILLFCAFALWGWQHSALSILKLLPPASAGESQVGMKPRTSQANIIRDLPCFQCHIYAQFVQEPAQGVFSHALHIQFDYHCNQCHSFQGHRQMVINTTVCTFCHDKIPELGTQDFQRKE